MYISSILFLVFSLYRTVFPKVSPRVEYSLRELGETMRPIMAVMESWGLGYKELMGKE